MSKSSDQPGVFIFGGIIGALIVGEVYDIEFSNWFIFPALAYSVYMWVAIIASFVRESDRRKAERAAAAADQPQRATRSDVR